MAGEEVAGPRVGPKAEEKLVDVARRVIGEKKAFLKEGKDIKEGKERAFLEAMKPPPVDRFERDIGFPKNWQQIAQRGPKDWIQGIKSPETQKAILERVLAMQLQPIPNFFPQPVAQWWSPQVMNPYQLVVRQLLARKFGMQNWGGQQWGNQMTDPRMGLLALYRLQMIQQQFIDPQGGNGF